MRLRPGSARGRSPGSEISVDWQRLADGRARRVVRGVDFSCSMASFREAATKVATGLGKHVLLTRDRLDPRTCVWVQFADAEIVEGSRCVCGGSRIRRIGLSLGRCRTCGATLILTERREGEAIGAEPANETAPTQAEGGGSLDDFSEIRLVRLGERRDDREYAGFGVDSDGRTVFLVVRTPLLAGAPITEPDSPLGVAHEVVVAKPAPSVHLHDPAELGGNEDEWDIVLL